MNNFHIYEEIGRGKYSVVYKVSTPALTRSQGRKKKSIEYVAVKSIDKCRRKKVLNEVRIFHALEHRNVLRFYNWYETRNHLWIIFEYCPAGDLYALIEQDKALPEETVLAFAKQLVEGLNYLHANSIVYADLKPSNVLINEYGTLKLSDFGLAKKVADLVSEKESSSLSGTSRGMRGTPYYMAPELFSDDGVHSFASDLWALGCVLYELGTGRPPFYSSSLTKLIRQVTEGETPRVEGFSAAFNELLEQLLEKDPIKRITWASLPSHAFWGGCEDFVTSRKLPKQPQFDRYLVTRGINPEHFYLQQNNQLAKKFLDKPKGAAGVDILRLSYNVKRHLKDANYEESEIKEAKDDVQINNRDMELNFGENVEEEEEAQPVSSAASTPSTATCSNKHVAGTEVSSFAGAAGAVDPEEKLLVKRTEQTDFKTAEVKGLHGGSATTVSKKPVRKGGLDVAEKKEYLSTVTPTLPKAAPFGGVTATKSAAALGAASTGAPAARMCPKSIEQLMLHNSDTQVKPIIGSKDVEKPVEVSYNAAFLSFVPWTLEQVQEKIEAHAIEAHLSEVYNAIVSNAGQSERVNALSYFESLINSSNVANRLINSAFLNLFVHMLRTLKSSSIKIRVCSIVGLLVRHATVIENEIAQSGVCELLKATLHDSNELVRRKAVSALGEYLFYAATQLDEESADPVWNFSGDVVLAVTGSLKAHEDDVVRLYACKTIENITA